MPPTDAEQPLIDDLNAVQQVTWGDFLKPFVFLGWAAFGMLILVACLTICIVSATLMPTLRYHTASQAVPLPTLATFKRFVGVYRGVSGGTRVYVAMY